MKRTTSAMVVLILLLPLSASSFAQELFRPVDGLVAEKATNYNSRFMSERLYFAKRHRIVEINVPMLREASIDSVTLFDGEEKVSLRRERIHVGQIHGAATWIGNIALPRENLTRANLSKADLEQIENSGITLEQIISQIGRVELQILYWDIDLTTKEAYPSAERRHKQVGPTPVAGAAVGDVEEHAFATVRGQIDLSVLGRGMYRLEPLRHSPRYHILYEVDRTKTFGVVEVDPSAKTEISDEGQKKLDYNKFLKSLPRRTEVVTKGDL